MTTTTRTAALALLAGLMLAAVPSAEASKPQPLLVSPSPGYLPRFGFQSYNIYGVGERVTFVKWNSLAGRLGLERGDTILAVNNFALSYHGAWHDALREAMFLGGYVELAIWDVRTGGIAYRTTFLGSPGYGPVTPKSHVTSYGPVTSHVVIGGGGPITKKSQNAPPKIKIDLSKQISKLAELIND
jgi:hypothetical protein